MTQTRQPIEIVFDYVRDANGRDLAAGDIIRYSDRTTLFMIVDSTSDLNWMETRAITGDKSGRACYGRADDTYAVYRPVEA